MADEARLIAVVEARTAQFERALRRVEQQTNRTFRGGTNNVVQFNRGMDRAAASATRLERSMSGIGTRGISALTGALTVGSVVRYADAWTEAGNKIAAASEIAGRQTRSLEDLNRLAGETRTGITATVDLYSKLIIATKDVAKSEEEVARATEIVNKAFKAGGATISEQTAGIQQLGQALGSGVLAGDELKSLRENAPVIAQAIAKEFNTTISGLKDLGKEGELTAARVFKGILAAQEEVERAFSRTEATVGDSLTRLGNAFTQFVGKLDGAVGLTSDLTAALNLLAGAMDKLTGVASNTSDAIGDAFGEQTIERLTGLMLDLDLGVERMRKFKEQADAAALATKGVAAEVEAFLEKLFSGKDAVLLDDADLEQIRQLRELLANGTTEAIDAARVAMERMAKTSPQFQPLVDILNRVAEAAKSISDRVRAAGAAAAAAVTASSADGAVGGFVDRVVGAESGGDRFAKNPDSSATGLGQFIESTWIDLFRRHFPDRAEGMTNAAVLALRTDAATSKQLIEAYARENAAVLQRAGVSVDEAALQLAHFLGAVDAAKVLQAAPGTPLQGLISQKSIDANPTILGGGQTVDDARAYAERRAGSQAAIQAYDAEVDAMRQWLQTQHEMTTARAANIAAIEQEIAALGIEAEAFGKSTFEAEKAAQVFDLTNKMIADGVTITPELAATIDGLAEAYARATTRVADLNAAQDATKEAQAGVTEKIQESAEQMDAIGAAAKDVMGGFINDLINGKSAAEAFSNALKNIASRLIDIGLNLLFQGGAGGGGIFGAIFGGLSGSGVGGAFSPAMAGAGGGAMRSPGALYTPRAIAPGSMSARSAAPAAVYIVAEEGAMFQQRVAGISGQVSVQHIRANEINLPRRLQQRQRRGLV